MPASESKPRISGLRDQRLTAKQLKSNIYLDMESSWMLLIWIKVNFMVLCCPIIDNAIYCVTNLCDKISIFLSKYLPLLKITSDSVLLLLSLLVCCFSCWGSCSSSFFSMSTWSGVSCLERFLSNKQKISLKYFA